jgi:hypothetical protein
MSKIKNIFRILFISIFFLTFIINKNYVNGFINNGKTNLIGKAMSSISTRVLEEIEKEEKSTTKICEKISDKLKNYYKTGDKSILGIDDDKITGKNGEHIDALISITGKYFSKKENQKKMNLLKFDKELLQYLITYGKHILPLVVILGIAILSFPGWIVCFGLCCCDCCCCCCCVKPVCKVPSFIFSYIFYGIVALVCFYGLGKSNSLFVGIADTKCSILKFIDQVVDGESKENPPYWAGIDKINEILDRLSKKVEEMKAETMNTLNSQKTEMDRKKDFELNLATESNLIHGDYLKNYDSKNYQLDLAYEFGKCDVDDPGASPENSICFLWIKEYETTANNAETCFQDTVTSFTKILNDNSESVSQDLEDSKESIKEIKEGFDKIKILIADNIIKYGDDFDKYGKLTFKLFYSILILMDAGIAAFMLLLCFCSGRLCNCCCCARCFCKFFIHILWNVMAICMIFLFLVGSLFTISGVVGEDMMSVVAYLVSEDNLGENSDTILFGEVKNYLNKCYNDNGDILAELGLNVDNMNHFQILKNSELKFNEIKQQFNDKTHKFVYNGYLSELNEKVGFNSDELSLISTEESANPPTLKFTDLLAFINNEAKTKNKNEAWDITSVSDKVCSNSAPNEVHTDSITYHPNKCFPTDKTWVTDDAELSDVAQKLDDFKEVINYADKDNNGIRKKLEGLGNDYDEFLKSEIDSIKVFQELIHLITDIVLEVSGNEEGIFAFINCKFIKSNTQILLVNLKNVFGNDLYMNGIYLLLAAFSLAFAISFTILLTVILKKEVEKTSQEKQNKKTNIETGDDDVPEMPIDSEEKVLSYKKN